MIMLIVGYISMCASQGVRTDEKCSDLDLFTLVNRLCP